MKDTHIYAILILAIILPLAFVVAIIPYLPEKPETRLNSFASYEDLKNFIAASSKYQTDYSYGGSPTSRWGLPNTFSTMESSVLPEYSITNVQVEGVDEADIVKTDGTYIYVISNQTIIILKAYPPEDAEILSRIKFNGTLRGVFINEDKLAAFEDTGYYYGDYRTMIEPAIYPYTQKTTIRVYNIADRAHPTSTRNVTVDGTYFNSRMIGDYAYIIVTQPVYDEENEVKLPVIYYPDRSEKISATEIYYSNTTDCFNIYTSIISVNLLDDQQDPTIRPILTGYASTIYVSQTNIYLTYPTYSTYITYPTYKNQEQTTEVHRIRVDNGDITYEASGKVPGYVLNQFSMDEHNNHFRIATTTGQVWATREGTSQNHVYVLDMDLDIVGKLEDLAPGERIYSARFMGNRCYLVTFKKIDPLFVIDLTNPNSPQVLGELEITGYSDYLHPYDETHIIGIGKETVEAEEGGNFAWYQGVKISLFDVSDVNNPQEIDKYEIGDRGTDSPILHDHKAFLFDKSRGLLVIPVTVAEINPTKYPGEVPPNAYGDFVWDGAYVFHISLEEGLVFQGGITHVENNFDLWKSGYYHSAYSVKRSLYIDNVLYTISDRKVKMNSLSDLSEFKELNLSD